MIKLSIFILLIIILLFFVFKSCVEKYKNYHVDVISRVSYDEVNAIMSHILQYINTNFNKNLVIGNLESVEKEKIGNKLHYKIVMFIYDTTKYTNKKLLFNITLDENNNIKINNINIGNSRGILSEERDGISGRNSKIARTDINFNNLEGYTKYNNVAPSNIIESTNKMQNRTQTILPKEAEKIIKNKVKAFPNKIVFSSWDTDGVQNVKKEPNRCGLNHANRKHNVVPDFFIHNYDSKLNLNICSDDGYNWLFDLTQDSASRPIGITGARGSS